MFDRCGVCDGDGTSCIGKRLTYKGLPNPMKGKLDSCKKTHVYFNVGFWSCLEISAKMTNVVKRET